MCDTDFAYNRNEEGGECQFNYRQLLHEDLGGGNMSSIEVDEVERQLKIFCKQIGYESHYCIPLKLENEITFDDLIYVSLKNTNNSSTQTSKTLLGVIIPIILISIGVVGNLFMMITLCLSRVSVTRVIGVFLSAISILYILIISIPSVLDRADKPTLFSESIVSCMIWPPLIDLLTHMTTWTVVFYALNMSKNNSNLSEIQREVSAFQMKILCAVITIISMFLNYHSMLLREIRDGHHCRISTKAETFYRDYWPWIKSIIAIYLPVVLIIFIHASTCITRRTLRLRDKLSLIYSTYFCVIIIATRVVLQPYEFSLYQSELVTAGLSSLEPNFHIYTALTRDLLITLFYSTGFLMMIPRLDFKACINACHKLTTKPSRSRDLSETGQERDEDLAESPFNIDTQFN